MYNSDLKDGDVIKLNQTVNGHNYFLIDIASNGKINDVKYWPPKEMNYRSYEYSIKELLSRNFMWEYDYDIIGNVYKNDNRTEEKNYIKKD